jgi:hypothetical protein
MEPMFTPVLPDNGLYPCGYCAVSTGLVDLSVATQQCQRCKIACYCSPEHQRMHWATHKKYCRETSEENQLAARKLFTATGLFTGGDQFFALPFKASQQAVELIDGLRRLREATGHKEAEDTHDWVLERHSIFKSPKYIYIGEQPTPRGIISCRLNQPGVCFHEQVYGLMHPADLWRLVEYMRAHEIVELVDLMAGRGMLPAMLTALTTWPATQTKAFDLEPPAKEDQFFPIIQQDATTADAYADSAHKLYVLGWPDFTNKASVSPTILQTMRECDVKHLLVLSEWPGSAMSEEGHEMLDRYFKPVTTYLFPSFNIEDTAPLFDLATYYIAIQRSDKDTFPDRASLVRQTHQEYTEYAIRMGCSMAQNTTLYTPRH